jgi:hypothetical protein
MNISMVMHKTVENMIMAVMSATARINFSSLLPVLSGFPSKIIPLPAPLKDVHFTGHSQGSLLEIGALQFSYHILQQKGDIQ